LLQRVTGGAGAFSAMDALELATRGGAQVLGRHDCGSLEPGKCADLVLWDVGDIESAGSWDPAALALAGPDRARDVFVNGQRVVADGRLATVDQRALAARQNANLTALMDRV